MRLLASACRWLKLLLSGRCTRCACDRYVTVTVPARTDIILMTIGSALMPMPITTPEHDERRYLCDCPPSSK